MSHTFSNYLKNEQPMNSALNSAHFSGRRADNHLKFGRYDEAIKCHTETVNFLTRAIAESTIPRNIENLQVQRKHHENIQQIILRQKQEFEDFLRRNGLKPIKKPCNPAPKENRDQFKSRESNNRDNIAEICVDEEFFSLVGHLEIGKEHPDNQIDQVKDDVSDEDDDFVSLQ